MLKKLAEKFSGIADKSYIESEFPFFLLYLRSIATSPISRIDMLKLASEKDIFEHIAKYLKRIVVLVNVWRYSQAGACEQVATKVPNKKLKTFLMRFAQSINSGEQTSSFISREYTNYMIEYVDSSERRLEQLKRLSDAYAAVLSSSTFLCATTLLSSLMLSFKMLLPIIILMIIVISAILFMITWGIFNAARPDGILAQVKIKPRRRVMVEILGIISIFLSFIVSMMIFRMLYKLSYSIAALGVPILISGALGCRYVNRVKECEKHYPTFLRQVSSICAAGIPLVLGFKDVLLVNYGPLNKPIKRLYAKLNLRIEPRVAWRSFEAEVSSELIRRINEIFVDTLHSGGDIEEVADLLESFYSQYVAIRRRRYQIVSYLKGLVVPLHITMAAVLGVIGAYFRLLAHYMTLISTIIQFLFIPPLQFIDFYFLLMIVTLSLNNTLAIYASEGDSRFTLLFYMGLFLLTGCVFYNIIGDLVAKFLSSLSFI